VEQHFLFREHQAGLNGRKIKNGDKRSGSIWLDGLPLLGINEINPSLFARQMLFHRRWKGTIHKKGSIIKLNLFYIEKARLYF
jgi:hypothetical protein